MKKSYRELKVWQASLDLTVLVYRLTGNFPQHELYGLSAQMRRASVSIVSNIAEGAGRNTRKDFKHFVLIARGSLCELETQLMVAVRLGYCNPQQSAGAEHVMRDIGRMLNGLCRFLENEIARKPPHSNQHPFISH